MANFEPTLKQHEFFKSFEDDELLEIGYGGAAGGGKSFVLWALMIIKSLEYPGIRIGLARNTLTDIKKNTMSTFYEVYNHLSLPDDFYNYNSMDGKITFGNGSIIQFYELRYLPSDPNYDRFGGALLTFGCIEEAAGCPEKGKIIFQSRLGRWKNDEFGISPKLLMTFNPGMNFLYHDFYLPWSKGELPIHRKFIQAKLSDNKYQSKDYRRSLELTMNEESRSRLLDGEWDFDSDKSRLLKYDEVISLYNINRDYSPSGDFYLSADIAFTGDKSIIILWKGLDIIKIIHYKGDEPELEILRLRDEYQIDPRRIVYDSDGVGKYLKGKLKYSYDFINNGKPLEGGNFDHIKSQVYFELADKIRNGEIKCFDNNLKEELIQEVYEIKSQPLDTLDGKLKIIRKKDIVAAIGRSPDISDAMAYRMVFEIKAVVRRPFSKSKRR